VVAPLHFVLKRGALGKGAEQKVQWEFCF
jgi:hypothetical protein